MKYEYIIYGCMKHGKLLSAKLCKDVDVLKHWLNILNIDIERQDALIKEVNQAGSVQYNDYNGAPSDLNIKIQLFSHVEEYSTPI